MDLPKNTYYSLLESPKWDEFRREIIKKRNYTCEICGKQMQRGLQVHHLRYYAGHKPWEYKDNLVQCLCVDCHRQLHEELAKKGERVPVYDSQGKRIQPSENTCYHCGGDGWLPDKADLLGGICLYCFGTGIRGYHRFTPFEARKYAQRMHNEWLNSMDKQHRSVDSGMPYDTNDLENWILKINDK